MQETVAVTPEAQAYYNFVAEHFDAVETAAGSGGLWVEY